jgi:hypothetical protein
VKKYAGPFSKLTASQRTSAPRRSTAASKVTYEVSERLVRSGTCALTSVATGEVCGDTRRGRGCAPGVIGLSPRCYGPPTRLAGGMSVFCGISFFPACL